MSPGPGNEGATGSAVAAKRGAGAGVVIVAVVAGALGLGLVVWQVAAPEPAMLNAPPDQAVPLKRPIAAAPAEKAPAVPAPVAVAPKPVEESLPRSATGAPARFVMSSSRHGIDVRHLGVAIGAPGDNWALKLTGTRAPLLFFWPEAEQPPALKLLGSTWLTVASGGGRVFAFQPRSWEARDMIANVVVARQEGGKFPIQQDKSRPRMLTEAFAFIDSEKFQLDGLESRTRYRLTSKKVPGAPSAPVIVVFFPEYGENLTRRRQRLPTSQVLGPPRQALLPVDGVVEFWGSAGFDAVMPTFGGAEESRVELTVAVASTAGSVVIERNSAEARALTPKSQPRNVPQSSGEAERSTGGFASPPQPSARTAQDYRDSGLKLMDEGRYAEASSAFRRCMALDSSESACKSGYIRANSKVEGH